MEKDNSKAYSEVIEILKLIDDEKLLEALPMEMLEVLKSKADPEYKPQISSEILLEEQNLQPETLQILSWIAVKYWNSEGENKENEDIQQEKLDKKGVKDVQQESLNKQDNEHKQQEENKTQTEKEEKINDIKNEQSRIKEINTTLPIAHNQLKWYEKIKIKIIEFINKLFKRNK